MCLTPPFKKNLFCENQSSAFINGVKCFFEKPEPYANWSSTAFQYVQKWHAWVSWLLFVPFATPVLLRNSAIGCSRGVERLFHG